MEAFNNFFEQIHLIVEENADTFETDEADSSSSAAIVSELLKYSGSVALFLDRNQEKIGYSLLTCIGIIRQNLKSLNECLNRVKKVVVKKTGVAKRAAVEEEKPKIVEIREVMTNIEAFLEEFLSKMDRSPLHLFFASLRCGHRGNSYLIDPLFTVTQTVMSSVGARSNDTFIKQIRSWKSFKRCFKYSFIGVIYKARRNMHT